MEPLLTNIIVKYIVVVEYFMYFLDLKNLLLTHLLVYSSRYSYSFTTESSISAWLFMEEVIMTNAHQKCGKLHIECRNRKKAEEKTTTNVCFCNLLIEHNLVKSDAEILVLLSKLIT